MSAISEEFLITQEHESNNSSNHEDSLTGKLGIMLHSSNDIIVENADFFKGSSNENTDMDEVDELFSSNNDSVQRLELDEHNRIKYKSGESYTSLGTVVRHEAPKIPHHKIKIIKPPRPQSAKPRNYSIKPLENFNKDLSICLHHIVKKHPDYDKVIKIEKNDLEKLFYKKVKEFKNLLEDNLGNSVNPIKEKLRIKNRQKEKKREEIRNKIREEELDRIKISNKKYKENYRKVLKNLVEVTLKKYQTIKMIEDMTINKEIEKKKNQQKKVVMENIKNLYDDKIQMLKEKINERKMYKALRDYEYKVIFSEADKYRKKKQKIAHEKNKNLLKKQVEDIKLESKAEEESIHKRIIKLYKNSIKSMRMV
ncbi:hypothetical protein SteCoe_29998 [Stentor coeruleus]|uniref:Uncharacterized protein n=1 Tax=Stentor coeruleus TaxID=5963 RepID=A0A1R2B4L9_9CILI|nr:hypothetical protein SteCoe_29998 [Stentor coeruleus]